MTFQYRSGMEPGSRKKHYTTLTISVFEFIARMLYFLPDHHQKAIRYYGLYASAYYRKREAPDKEACSWSAGIQHSFEHKPENCPDCRSPMERTVVFSHAARHAIRRLSIQYVRKDGYFRPIRPP